jgi:hypothetical protein
LQVATREVTGGTQLSAGGSVGVTVHFRYCGSGKLKGRMQWRVMYQGDQLAEDDSSQALDLGDWRTEMHVKIPSGSPPGRYSLETRFLSIGAPVTDSTEVFVGH